MGETPGVSGTVVRANRQAFAELLGEEVVTEWLASDRRFEFWNSAMAVGWVELGLVEESVVALGGMVAKDPVWLNMEATRKGTARAFKTVWRVLLRLTTDDALVARAPILYKRAFNVGRMEYVSMGPHKGELRLSGWRAPPAFHMHGLRAGIETMLRVAGRHDAQVNYEQRGALPVFTTFTRAAASTG